MDHLIASSSQHAQLGEEAILSPYAAVEMVKCHAFDLSKEKLQKLYRASKKINIYKRIVLYLSLIHVALQLSLIGFKVSKYNFLPLTETYLGRFRA